MTGEGGWGGEREVHGDCVQCISGIRCEHQLMYHTIPSGSHCRRGTENREGRMFILLCSGISYCL